MKTLLAVAIITIVYGIFEYHWLKVVKLKMSDFGLNEVPDTLKRKRIVFVSDFQFDHKLRGFMNKAAQNVVETINRQNPDLVILGGDFIHQKHSKNREIFKYIKAINGQKIAVLGNHDYRDVEAVVSELEEIKVQVLVNELINYNGLEIIGVDDYREGKPEFPSRVTYPCLLVTHNPDYLEKIPHRVDLALAGHLHGGQITLFGAYAPISNSENGQNLLYGMKHRPNGTMYVSSGVGGSAGPLPIRLFARPEVVVIDCEIN